MANDINIIIGGDVRQLERAMDDAVRRVRSSTDTMSGSISGFQNLLIGAFSLDKLKAGLDFAKTFDDNLRQVQAAAKLTAEQFDVIKQKALELGKEPGQTPELIAAGMANAARAGQNFNQILESITGTARLAAGSELDFAQATESSNDILAQYGLTSKDTAALTDVLIAGANSASVKVEQLAESFKFAGSLSSVLGESVIDTEAALLVLANAGQKAELGGTALRGVWTQLIKHSDTLQKTFGVTVSKMENGKRVFRSLDEIIGDLSKSGIQADEVFKIFGKTAGPAAAILLKAGQEGLLKYEDQLKNASGTGQEVAETLQSGLGGSMRTISSAFQNAVLIIVDEFVPAITFVSENIKYLESVVLGAVGVINTMREAYATMLSTAVQGVSYFAEISDAIGVTSGQAEHLKQVSTDFAYVADEMGQKAGKAFNEMVDGAAAASTAEEKHKETVDLTNLSYKKGAEEHDKLVEDVVSGTEEMSKADTKAAKEREKAVDDMYKTLKSSSSDYYEREADKAQLQAAQFEELGGKQEEIHQHLYDRLSELSADAYAKGNEASGAYLDNLRAGFNDVTVSISADHQKLVDEFEKLSGEKIEIRDDTDWDGIAGEIEDLKSETEDLDASVTVEDGTDWTGIQSEASDTSQEIADVSDAVDELDGKSAEVKIDADTSGVETMTGSVGVAMNSVEDLRSAVKLFNETPTLDPFGDTRAKYEKQIQQLNGVRAASKSLANELNSLDFSIDPNGEMSAKYREQLDKVLEDSTSTAADVAKVRVDAEKDIQKAREEAEKAHEQAEKEYQKEWKDREKERLQIMKDDLSTQLNAAKETLTQAKQNQKDYYGYLIGEAKDYYDKLKDERDKALEQAKENAQEEYDQAEELLNKKLTLAQQELNGGSKKLSALRQIYKDSGAGGQEYYRLEQKALAQQAQDFYDADVDRIDVETWLQDELSDLRTKAAEEGIDGLQGYENQIMSTYQSTGNFSDETVKAEEKVASLQAQLEQLKEAGTESFFDDSSVAAQNFDGRLQAADNSVKSLQSQLDGVNGKQMDFAGKSADFFSTAVTAAQTNVNNLESKMVSLDAQVKQVNSSYSNFNELVRASGSTPTVSNSATAQNTSNNNKNTSNNNSGTYTNTNGQQFFNGYGEQDKRLFTYAGGGYTGNNPRSGGLDGQGGFFAILHPQESVVDHTVATSNSGTDANAMFDKLLQAVNNIQGGTNIVIEKISVDKKMDASEIDALVADLQRRARRG